jgi:hypothetical protein
VPESTILPDAPIVRRLRSALTYYRPIVVPSSSPMRMQRFDRTSGRA